MVTKAEDGRQLRKYQLVKKHRKECFSAAISCIASARMFQI